MPRGYPTIGNAYGRREELSQPMPRPEVLGTISNDSPLTDPRPQSDTVTWTREDGTVVELTEPAPPWETNDDKFSPSDARRFVECPPNWRLHWVNPRLLDSEGWRDWQPVMSTDHRVTVRVPTMVTPENYIRRGGPSGDILCWMWAGWYESIKLKMQQKTESQTQSAVNKTAALKDEFSRGTYGPYIRVDGATHPSHTQIDGRSIQGDN